MSARNPVQLSSGFVCRIVDVFEVLFGVVLMALPLGEF